MSYLKITVMCLGVATLASLAYIPPEGEINWRLVVTAFIQAGLTAAGVRVVNGKR